MKSRTWKLLEILDATTPFFQTRGIENPRLQAELLLSEVLHLRRLDLYLQFGRILTPAEVAQYRDYVRQREQGVPVQYITGEAAFRHLVLGVSREVLIPRPETEVLVDAALEYLAPLAAPRVLDLGCGSGAIAISLAFEHPTAWTVAADISLEAVRVTRRNAERHGVGGRVALLCGDLLQPVQPLPVFDAIVSNPPYVRRGDLAGLDREVRDHEPGLALDGGEDGLDYYRRLAGPAAALLVAGGRLILEVGDGQAQTVADLLAALAGFEIVEIRPDWHHIPRVVVSCPGRR